MRKRHQRIIALGAAFALNVVCQGQTLTPAPGPNGSPPLTISGTIFDPSGAPAPGVVLVLPPAAAGSNAEVKSDETGKYNFTWKGLPQLVGGGKARAYSLIARDVAHNFAAAHAVDEATTNLDLHLQPGLTVSAQVKDSDGKPITNATGTVALYLGTVETAGVAGSATTSVRINRRPIRADDQGRIQFSALAQGCRYSVYFGAEGHGSSLVQTIQEADTDTTSLELPVVVLKSANLILACLVLGADGQPAAGAQVGISGVMQPITSLRADATGHFKSKVCEGAVSVSATGPGVMGIAQTVGGDTNVVIRLTMPLGK
jgi:hypothetical protein